MTLLLLRFRNWPILAIVALAAIPVWASWVRWGAAAGFDSVRPLPGVIDGFAINAAIAPALSLTAFTVWSAQRWSAASELDVRDRRAARWSTIAAGAVLAAGHLVLHLPLGEGFLTSWWAAHGVVACIPLAVLAAVAVTGSSSTARKGDH